ncbi:MAG: MarR family transcriptional regulator [Firmicutes bacterium]|nr:MarR family transcriptional regulator [Bacillota bacterium]
MNKNISNVYNLLQEIAWVFGNHDFNGGYCKDLSLVEFMALKRVYENKDFSIREVGTSLNFTKSGATRVIDRLESKGYVIREHSPIDGRVCCVRATNKGINILTEVIKKNTEYLEKVFKNMKPEMIYNIENALKMLVELLQEHSSK